MKLMIILPGTKIKESEEWKASYSLGIANGREIQLLK